MSLRPVLQNRDFTKKIETGRLNWTVNSLEWEAVGGCSQASLTAYGPELDLWEMIECLRCPITIYDEKARPVWWGFVSEATVRIGGIEVGVTISSMTNRIAVAYSFVETGTNVVGRRKTTAWSEDADAAAEYGKKEWISSGGGMTDASALARRDAILEKQKWPAGVTTSASIGGYGSPRPRVRGSGAEDSQSASLICRGWWDTLDWQYASWASVVGPAYVTALLNDQWFGYQTSHTKVFQQFSVGVGSINALSLTMCVRKIGAPADNLNFNIYELDGSGNPSGSAVVGASIAGGSLTTGLDWYTLSITETELAANTMYGLALERSGGIDAANYYTVAVDPALGYAGGAFKIWNGTAWVSRPSDVDMNFQINVNNQVESTSQVRDMAIAYGEFIEAVDIDTASGVLLPSYRDGDTTALEEIRQLLVMGGPNGRRYLAEVDENRRLHIWEEPAVQESYYLDRWGDLSDARGMMITPWMPPVGIWARLRDVIPASADTSKLADPTLQFIEAATWASGGGLTFRFRGQVSIDEIMRIK